MDNVMVGCADSDESPTCGARPKQGPGCDGTLGPGVVHTFFPMGNVHKSVDGSLWPLKITYTIEDYDTFLVIKYNFADRLAQGANADE